MGKRLFFLLCSLLTTSLLLYYIFTRPTGLSWDHLLTRFNPVFAWIYLALYLLGLLLRTWRYRWLVQKASSREGVPFFAMTMVTASRNMLVDLLPARIGGLSYPILLNRVVGVELSHCLTSFTYAFIFDLLSLGPLLGMVVVWDYFTTPHSYPWLLLLSVLILGIGVLVLVFLEPIVKAAAGWIQSQVKGSEGRHSRRGKISLELEALSRSFSQIKKEKGFWPLLGISLAIRVVKYTLLYLMLRAVVEALLMRELNLPFLTIVFGLVGSEVAASLPVSGLAGIGFYEGFLGATLTGLGIQAVQGVAVALTMHVLTQVVDYSLGIGALGYLIYQWTGKKKLLLDTGDSETGKPAAPNQ